MVWAKRGLCPGISKWDICQIQSISELRNGIILVCSVLGFCILIYSVFHQYLAIYSITVVWVAAALLWVARLYLEPRID